MGARRLTIIQSIFIVLLVTFVGHKATYTFKLLRTIQRFQALESPHYKYVGFDFPRELPGKYGEVALLFEKNDTSYPLTDNDAWNSLVPPELGLTRIGPKGRPFGLAIYHQLHCLNSIRYMYMVARLGLTLDSNVDTSYMHNTHCIHFLRQGLLCHPDLTLIPVNGTQGELHRCRDWSKIRKFVEDNQDEWKGVSLTHAWEDADISVE